MTEAADPEDYVELSPEDAVALAEKCWRSPAEFARTFLGQWFPSQMPWIHRGIAALRTRQVDFLLDFGEEWWPEDYAKGQPSYWTQEQLVKIVANFVYPADPNKPNDDLQPIFELDFGPGGDIVGIRILSPVDNNAFALPRGFSKTTLENMMNLRDVCYREAEFILYVSEAAAHAERQVITIRRQLEQNTLLRAVFGDLVPGKQSSLKWTDGLIETTNGQRIGGIGSGGQVRGMSLDAVRPRRIVIDDFQDREGVKVEAQREKDMSWFIGTLMPSRQIFGANPSRVDFIGTILHKDAVLSRLRNDPDWHVVVFGALDRQQDPTWEYAIDKDKLAKLRNSFLIQGKLEEFELEYMSNSIDDRTAAFPLEKLTKIRREEDWYVAKALIHDPAISEDRRADPCAIVCVGIGPHGRIHIQDCHLQVGMEIDKQIDRLFEMYFAHMAHLPPELRKVGIEAVAFQRSLISAVTTQQHERSRTWGDKAFFEVIPILHGRGAGKVLRVEGLLKARFRAGHVSSEFIFSDLEAQLSDWPNGKKDGPDAIAMGIQLLDPYAPLNAGVEVQEQLATKQSPVTRAQLLAAASKAP